MYRLLPLLWRSAATLPAVALGGVAARVAATSVESPFLAENDAAMTKMMAAMAIKPSGDVDKDFVAMMAPAQAVNYVPNAVPEGDGMQGLEPLGVAGQAAHLSLIPLRQDTNEKQAPTSVSLFDQLMQVLQAAVTGLEPMKAYVLALPDTKNGEGRFESLATFMTNPAGSAIVDAMGPIRQLVRTDGEERRRYLVIAPGTPYQHGARAGSGGLKVQGTRHQPLASGVRTATPPRWAFAVLHGLANEG
jgi:hypothetical protein